MKLPTTFQEIGDFSAYGLGALLPSPEAEEWTVSDLRQRTHAVHNQTRSIIFRWPARPWKPGEPMAVTRRRDASPALHDAVDACTGALEAHFAGVAIRLMLAELGPGAEVAAHTDRGPALQLCHRCHVPVRTNPLVEFWIDHQLHHFREGVAYEVDNTRLHSVANRGTTPRVHLICDVMPRDLYAAPHAARPERTLPLPG